MKPLLKIRGTFPFGIDDNYFINLLSKKHDIKYVSQDEDLFIEVVGATPFLSSNFRRSKNKLLISGENINYKLNLFKLIQVLSKKVHINLTFLNRILPRIITNLNIAYLRGPIRRYMLKNTNKFSENLYAILPNNFNRKNIFALPNFFWMVSRKNLKKLEKKKTLKKIKKNKFCAILFSNESSYERIKFTKLLSKYKKVDIYGPNSLNNVDNSKISKNWEENIKFFSQYKFIIAIENSFEKEVITERLPIAMLSNSIPIYRGSPNIRKYFNTKSFINFEDYQSSYNKMIDKIMELDKDDKKYLNFLNQQNLTEKNKLNIKNKESELKKFLGRVI